MSLSVSLTFRGEVPHTAGLVALRAPIALDWAMGWADGVANGQFDRFYSAEHAVAAGGNHDLDLFGILLDALGRAAAFAKVDLIALQALPANAAALTVGGGNFHPYLAGTTPTLQLNPGGVMVFRSPAAGWPVTNTSADTHRVSNGGGASSSYRVAILGRSA